MTAQTIENTIKELNRRQIKPIKLLDSDGNPASSKKPPVIPLDEVRLNKDLRRLINLDYITREKDGRYVPLLVTQDMMTIHEHKHMLDNIMKLEKERARAIQQRKVKPEDLCSIHILEGETTIYSPLFMSKKHRRKYEAEVQRIARMFNRVMDELYSLIQQHSCKDFNIPHPLVTVVIDEPWHVNPEVEKAVFNQGKQHFMEYKQKGRKKINNLLMVS